LKIEEWTILIVVNKILWLDFLITLKNYFFILETELGSNFGRKSPFGHLGVNNVLSK